MSVRQISVFLENKPGQLNQLTEILAENNIDMRALSLAETSEFGIVRLIVEDVYEATQVLKDAGFVSSLTKVVAVAIPDEAGGLNRILKVFTAMSINIEYMYAFLGGKETKQAYMIFRVDDYKTASAALRSAGLKLLDQDDISDL